MTLHPSASWPLLNPKLVHPPTWDALLLQQLPDLRVHSLQVSHNVCDRVRIARCSYGLLDLHSKSPNLSITHLSDSLNSGDGLPPQSPSSTAVVACANPSSTTSPFFTTVAFASDMGSRLMQKVSHAEHAVLVFFLD